MPAPPRPHQQRPQNNVSLPANCHRPAAVGYRSPWAVRHDSVGDLDDPATHLRLVLNRLDVLGLQVEDMLSGQLVLEAAVKQIHTDIVQLPGHLDKHVSVIGVDQIHQSRAPTPVDHLLVENAGMHPNSLVEQSRALCHLRDNHDLGAQQDRAEGGSDNEDSNKNNNHMKFKIRARSELAAHRFDSGLDTVESGGTELSAPNYIFGKIRSSLFRYHRRNVQPLHPESWGRAIFDITAMIMLLYESVWIPYQLTWNKKLEGAILALSFISAGFWTLDLVLGFGTGYRDKDDRLVMTFRGITCHYLRTTFCLNLIVVVADITSIALELNLYTYKLSSTPWVVKFARVIKLNRLLRLEALFKTGRVALISAYIVTYMRKVGLAELYNFVVRILTLIFVIIWVNHVGGCIWRSVGAGAWGQWVTESPETADWPYLMDFYWSTSALIAGSTIMTPTNKLELAVTEAFVLFGFIFNSILISWLINAVMDYGAANRERISNLKQLRQFFCQNSLDSRLSLPIEKQANARMASVRRLTENDVNALSLVSPSLRVELQAAMYGPSVSRHAFMRMCNILKDSFIQELCFSAISLETEESGKVIFSPNIEAVGARIVYWGSLDYHPRSVRVQPKVDPCFSATNSRMCQTSAVVAPAPTTIPVVKGDWISEVALWAHWQHIGYLESSTPCELLTLRAESFMKVMIGYPDSLARIANAYSSALLKATEEEFQLEMVNDLRLPVQHESIVSAMPLRARIGMSSAALQILDRQNHWNSKLAKNAVNDLWKEIETGECDMYVDEKEHVQRVMTIVALRLEKQDGSIVAQIGKCQRGESSARCTLPGTKIKVGELPRDAIDRLVNSKLQAYKDGLVWGRIEVDQEERISKKFGLKSKYQRTVFHANLQPDFVPVENTLPKREREFAPTLSLPSRLITRQERRKRKDDRSTIGEILKSDRRAFTLGNMQTTDSTFVFAWLTPDDHFLLKTGDESDKILKRWISEVDLSEVEELSKSVSISGSA